MCVEVVQLRVPCLSIGVRIETVDLVMAQGTNNKIWIAEAVVQGENSHKTTKLKTKQ